MKSPHFDQLRLQELLLTSSDDSFTAAQQDELNTILRDHALARSYAARFLIFDAQVKDALATSAAATTYRQTPIPVSKAPSHRSSWLAHAAAWIGAFHLFGNPSHGATIASTATTSQSLLTKTTITILMKKMIASITSIILLIGGSGIFITHRTNQAIRARLATMETEIQSLSDQLGIKTSSVAARQIRGTSEQKPISITQVLAIFDGGDVEITRQEGAILDQFEKQLAEMDVEAMKNLLLDAEKLGNPIHGRVAERIMAALILKDPAEATKIASLLICRGSEFQFLFSAVAAEAFSAWFVKNPAAADAWYVEQAAAGSLFGKSIAPNGLENYAIDRSFARLRFAAQMAANPAEAAAMMATMLPDDVTAALKEVTNPETLRAFLPHLPAERRGPATEGAIKAMAVNDLNAAFRWAASLEMSNRDRGSLLATGIEAAVGNGKLDLAGVSEWSKSLNLDPQRHSEMLTTAAANVSVIPGQKNLTNRLPAVAWDRTAERIDWLRKEVSADAADEAVGSYLGRLFSTSLELDQALQVYEQEVARQGRTDPDLAMSFASRISVSGDDKAQTAALELLHKLPPSEKRDDRIQIIEMNR